LFRLVAQAAEEHHVVACVVDEPWVQRTAGPRGPRRLQRAAGKNQVGRVVVTIS
jgi:hypothetical protein